MEELRECKKHGLTPYVLTSEGKWKCKKCRTEAVQRRRDKIKELAVQYKGGKCCICGYNNGSNTTNTKKDIYLSPLLSLLSSLILSELISLTGINK